eukprot:6320770-Ditylum_brightwellii.AAC.1
MKCVVADKSLEKYINENITLLLWFYNDDNLQEDLLRDDLVVELHAVASDDAGTMRRTKRRHICRTWLTSMKQGDDDTCPIVLEKM